MLQELSAILEERDVQITVSNSGDGKFTVHIDPQPLQCIGGGEHFGYTLPLNTSGTLQELELGLPFQILLYTNVRQKFIESLHSLEAQFHDALKAPGNHPEENVVANAALPVESVEVAATAPVDRPIPAVEVTPVVQELLDKVAANKAATASGHTPVRGRRGRPKKSEARAAAASTEAAPVTEAAVVAEESVAEPPASSPVPAEEMTAADSFSAVEVTDEAFTGSIANIEETSSFPLDDDLFF